MLKIEHTEVVGWKHAIRGMRNPMNSWTMSDSVYGCSKNANKDCLNPNGYLLCENCPRVFIGPNDYKLMMKLRNAGTDHRKYMRMIAVYVDITAPLYWWKEFDTYKVGTVANSCSTMHKIHEKEFTLEDFSCERLTEDSLTVISNDSNGNDIWSSLDVMHLTVIVLNELRHKFIETEDKKYWHQMIQLLPSSYNQKRTVMLNYEVLANMYKSRKSHKLDEWHTLCDWIRGLPYSEFVTLEKEDVNGKAENSTE